MGISWDCIGSRGRSLRYWAHSPHDKHFSLIVACIPGQNRDSRAHLMLLSTGALCVFSVTSRLVEWLGQLLGEICRGHHHKLKFHL